MWQPNENLIQIEIGAGVVKQFTTDDKRGLFGRLMGDAPSAGNLLVASTDKLRKDIQQYGVFLPGIAYRSGEEELDDNEFVSYFGLEIDRGYVNEPSDLLNYLVKKAHSYSAIQKEDDYLGALLVAAIDGVNGGNLQSAYKAYALAYYHASLEGREHERLRAVSDAAGIHLLNSNARRAYELTTCALLICNNPNIVDAALKIQASINGGNSAKLMGDFKGALDSFAIAINIALSSGDVPALFISLVSISEVKFLIEDFSACIFFLEQADILILSGSSGPNFEASRTIQNYISKIKSIIIYRLEKEIEGLERQMAEEQVKSFFRDLITRIFSTLATSLVQGAVYKHLGIAGSAGIALFGLFRFKDNNFVKSQIGTSNVMQIEKAVAP